MAVLAGPLVPALFTACTVKLCGPSGTLVVSRVAEKPGATSEVCTTPSISKLMWPMPETASDAEAEIATCPFSTCPAVMPVSVAPLGGAVSIVNEDVSVAKIPALFCTEAVRVCAPSGSADEGVNCRDEGPTLPVTSCPSRISDALVTLMPVSGSLRVMEIAGFELLINAPFAGELSRKTGGVVSGQTKVLGNANVCTFPPKETAPFTVTV